MNQILSVDDNQKRKNKKVKEQKVRNSGPVAIENVVKFFAIVIIIFGLFLIGSGSYSMYLGTNTGTSNAKPTIQIEKTSDSEINLRVKHDKALDVVTYKWSNEDEVSLNATGKREVSQRITVPGGENTLTVYAKDVNGVETTSQQAFNLDTGIDIDFQLDGSNIKVSINADRQLSYLTYRWDEEEEQRVDINNNTIEQSVEIPKGQHTLTVIVVDENNQTQTATQEVKGVTKPQLEITTDGSANFIIKASDEEGLKKLEFTVNDTDNYRLNIDGRTELEYTWPIQDGENILEVTVYNQNDVTETTKVRVVK